MYQIWKARNEAQLESSRPEFNYIQYKCDKIWQEYNDLAPLPLTVNDTIKWQRPSTPYYKVNVFAASCREEGGTMSCIIRYYAGQFIGCKAKKVNHIKDVLLLEALAI